MRISVKTASAVTTILGAMVVVTPLCGMLFACGCTWPLFGLFFDCNYFQSVAVHRCPWCASLAAGWLSLGSSIVLGAAAALVPLGKPFRRPVAEWGVRVGAGFLVFIGIALVAGWLAARSQGYPDGWAGAAVLDAVPGGRISADRFRSTRSSR